MNLETLQALERLNQLRLTEEERTDFLSFFATREAERSALDAFDTENTERMVWVAPMENVLREDVADQPFSREALQAQAPEAMDDYWQVPRVAN